MSALPEAVYAALSSDVYHSNKLDQWIDIQDINDNFKIRLASDTPPGLTPALLAMGFVGPTSDGFYYTPRGFGVRLVQAAGQTVIVYRGTDVGDIGPGLLAAAGIADLALRIVGLRRQNAGAA